MKKIFYLTIFMLFTVVSFAKKEAQVQFIHNIGFEGNQEVDVWLTTEEGSEKFVDDFEFRTATPFIDVVSNTDITFSFADANSTSIFDTLPGFSFQYNLNAKEVYVIIAESTTEELGSINKEFELVTYATGKSFIEDEGYSDVLIHHGKKNVITFSLEDIDEKNFVKKFYKNNVLGYLKLPTTDYSIEARDTLNISNTEVKSYKLMLSEFNTENKPIVVLASGYLDALQDYPDYEFGIYAALPEGGSLIPLDEEELDNSNFTPFELVIHPNPTNSYLEIPDFTDRITSLSLFNFSGRKVASLKNVRDNLLDVSFLPRGTYELVITTESKRISYLKIEKY